METTKEILRNIKLEDAIITGTNVLVKIKMNESGKDVDSGEEILIGIVVGIGTQILDVGVSKGDRVFFNCCNDEVEFMTIAGGYYAVLSLEKDVLFITKYKENEDERSTSKSK